MLAHWPLIVAGIAVGEFFWILCWVLGVWTLFPLLNGFIGAGLAAMIGAWMWHSARGQLWLTRGLVTALCAALFITATPFTSLLAGSLIQRDPIPSGTADAVMVLSAGVSDAGLLNSEGLDRFLTGVQPIRDGRASVVVVSRPAEPLSRGYRPDRDWAMLLSLLPTRPELVVLGATKSTHDEAVQVAQVARQRRWRRVYVVTSPMHTMRACATVVHAGISVICVPSESWDMALPTSSSAQDRLAAFSMWLHEMVGLLVYRMRGWV